MERNAQMAELVDAQASGACVRKDVEVRVFFWAPIFFSKKMIYIKTALLGR